VNQELSDKIMLLRAYRWVYTHTGMVSISDLEFDNLYDDVCLQLRFIDPAHPFLFEVGAPVEITDDLKSIIVKIYPAFGVPENKVVNKPENCEVNFTLTRLGSDISNKYGILIWFWDRTEFEGTRQEAEAEAVRLTKLINKQAIIAVVRGK